MNLNGYLYMYSTYSVDLRETENSSQLLTNILLLVFCLSSLCETNLFQCTNNIEHNN